MVGMNGGRYSNRKSGQTLGRRGVGETVRFFRTHSRVSVTALPASEGPRWSTLSASPCRLSAPHLWALDTTGGRSECVDIQYVVVYLTVSE